MSISYNIGSLMAHLQLTAVASLQGKRIQDGLEWQLLPENPTPGNPLHTETCSQDAQPLFKVPEGLYHLSVLYQGKRHEYTTLPLEKNTLTDLVILLQGADYFDEAEPTHLASDEFDARIEYQRRMSDRQRQSAFGHAATPLATPPETPSTAMEAKDTLGHGDGDGHEGTMEGARPQAHPILSKKVQFDGIDPSVRPDPNKNEESVGKQLDLIKQNQARPDLSPFHRPRMSG